MTHPKNYSVQSTEAAYALRWSWSGWPSQGEFPTLSDEDWNLLIQVWELDGIRLLERNCQPDHWQVTVSTKPGVVPSFIVARLKGRLDHHFRSKKIAFKFSRKVSLRTIGNNTAEDVQKYIRNQVTAAKFCDPGFVDSLQQFTRVWDEKISQAPIEVSSGRYWYQLHLVLVVEDRHCIGDLEFLGKIFEASQAIALDRGFLISAISVMPDHLHVSLRGVVSDSPESIALTFMNETCARLGVAGLWRPGFYVGTIGAYRMNAVRR